eukprot:14737149-Heterocapsa_arctica.AAC.1
MEARDSSPSARPTWPSLGARSPTAPTPACRAGRSSRRRCLWSRSSRPAAFVNDGASGPAR